MIIKSQQVFFDNLFFPLKVNHLIDERKSDKLMSTEITLFRDYAQDFLKSQEQLYKNDIVNVDPKYSVFYLCKSKIFHPDENSNDQKNPIYNYLNNFIVPSSIKSKMEVEKHDEENKDISKFKWIYDFIAKKGNSIRLDDFIPILDNLQPDYLNDFCLNLQWRSIDDPAKVFDPLNIPITIGWRTNNRIESYYALEYPIGQPKRSGQSKMEASVTNYDWISCGYQNDDSKKHSAITPQVNSILEEIEDKHTTLDIEIVRNSNALRYFLTNGPNSTAYSSPMIQLEMNAVYGKGGALILELLQTKPSVVYSIIVKRLRERAIMLREKKILSIPKFAENLEKALPSQRAKYMTFPHFKKEIPEFLRVGEDPIEYPSDLIFLLLEFMDIYERMIGHIYDLSEMKAVMRKITHDLANTDDESRYTASFFYASSLCSAGMLLRELSCVKEIDERAKNGTRIPTEIAMITPENHGHHRILNVIVDTIIKKKWTDGVRELAGLLLPINLDKALLIIRTAHLLIKCISSCAQMKYDSDIAIYSCNSSILTVKSLNDQKLILNLAKFEQ